MEKLVEVGILFDYYGELLSKKQYKMVDEYYNEDLSLTEIAEIYGVSKQAVSENIKRAVNKLYEFEENLRLMKKNDEINKLLTTINLELEMLEVNTNDKDKLEKIVSKINKFQRENMGDSSYDI
ncbi:YlxM family DNA-binding protein [Miniphocaeibacter massiliensis]|uniref:YlxM family DNA-binding protein n=1 Tax=Miniphocaeibacter massiliensis TaxID=2041841 RepID=UPI000C085C0F|nr:sigma factor-like helix-turn-helix DNA-binding protein [Miniphocaeibacter massiliensis]